MESAFCGPSGMPRVGHNLGWVEAEVPREVEHDVPTGRRVTSRVVNYGGQAPLVPANDHGSRVVADVNGQDGALVMVECSVNPDH